MKNNIVNVRFTDMDYFLIKTLCDRLGVSISDYVRSAVLKEANHTDDVVQILNQFYKQRGN